MRRDISRSTYSIVNITCFDSYKVALIIFYRCQIVVRSFVHLNPDIWQTGNFKIRGRICDRNLELLKRTRIELIKKDNSHYMVANIRESRTAQHNSLPIEFHNRMTLLDK
jgi:hypothetical protein